MKNFNVKLIAIAASIFVLASCNIEPEIIEKVVEMEVPAEPTAVISVSVVESVIIPEGDSETITAVVLPEDADNKLVVWSSNATDVAMVDKDGKVTALKKGMATITATTGDGGLTATCDVTVIKTASGVSINYESLTLMANNEVQLKALITPEGTDNQNVRWSNDDSSIARIDDNGILFAMALGETVVTVTSEDGGFEAQCPVEVIPPHDFFGTIGFRSTKEWTVGSQTWSDVVMSSGCKKNDFKSTSYSLVECRQNSGGYGDLYSYTAAWEHAADLCPNGWRMPTAEDFLELNTALGGTTDGGSTNDDLVDAYLNVWGGEFGGTAHDNIIVNQDGAGLYWSQTLPDSTWSVMNAIGLQYTFTGYINPNEEMQKSNGYPVRCVK